ncbi:DUF4173 domain-containing protein [Bacillaceae bacterium Marseille-Q3522]|nr:DUF4173 domain-containing protein [Bacillaceae bacterium Marseille-Q3522]
MNSNDQIVNKKNIYLLLSTTMLGILTNILFYGNTLGISYPIFVIVFYTVFFLHTRAQLQKKAAFAWLLLIPIVMLSLNYLFNANIVFYILNFLAIPVLVVMQTTLITGREKEKWYTVQFIFDILYGFFYRPFAFLAIPFKIIGLFIRKRTGLKKDSILSKILLGILISFPLLIVIVSLLASADLMFGQMIEMIPDLFVNINIGDMIGRFLLFAVVTVFAFSYICSLIQPKPVSKNVPVQLNTNLLDGVIAITVLSIINVIYVIFTFIQFSYLFGSMNNALPANFTYAEYARRGFSELVLVTIINMSIVLAFIFLSKKSGKAMKLAMRFLQTVLVLCTFVMLFSAHFRMSLYEEAYGYTYNRLLTHAFMVFLFVLFAITLYRIWREKAKLFRLYLLTGIVAFLVINYINIDRMIAKSNIARYETTGKLDISYLTVLSEDAIPEILPLLEDENNDISGRIENYLFHIKEELQRNNPWQSFNLSKSRAKNILANYELQFHEEYRDYMYEDDW